MNAKELLAQMQTKAECGQLSASEVLKLHSYIDSMFELSCDIQKQAVQASRRRMETIHTYTKPWIEHSLPNGDREATCQ